jgi:CRISPR/Cas system CMR-associated protein Cmr5 small subunit
MFSDLTSLINKLPDTSLNSDLELRGQRVETKYQELAKRFPALVHNKQIGLAILFQHLDLTLFTDNELLAVAKLQLEYLETVRQPDVDIHPLTADLALYDTGSSRIYSLTEAGAIAKASLHTSLSAFNVYTSLALRDIILSLYTLGY